MFLCNISAEQKFKGSGAIYLYPFQASNATSLFRCNISLHPTSGQPALPVHKGRKKELWTQPTFAQLLRERGIGCISPSTHALIMWFNQPYHRKQKEIASFSTTLSFITMACIEKVQSELKTVIVHNYRTVEHYLFNLQCRYKNRENNTGMSNLLNSTIYYRDNLNNLWSLGVWFFLVFPAYEDFHHSSSNLLLSHQQTCFGDHFLLSLWWSNKISYNSICNKQ